MLLWCSPCLNVVAFFAALGMHGKEARAASVNSVEKRHSPFSCGREMFVRPDAVRRDSDDEGGVSSGSEAAASTTPPDKATLLKVLFLP